MQFSTAQSSRSLLHILFFFHTLSFFGLSARFVVISSSLTPPSTFSLSFSNSLPSFPHFLQLFLTWACRLFLPITHLPWLSPLFWCLIIGVLSPVLLSNEPKDRFVLEVQNLMMSSLMITSMAICCGRKIKSGGGAYLMRQLPLIPWTQWQVFFISYILMCFQSVRREL